MQEALVLAADQPQPGWLTALIAAGGVVVGALLAAAGAIYTAKKKAQELDITYSQRLRDSYLENARSYLHSVYLPVHLALARLMMEYRKFRAHVDLKSGVAEEGYKEAFEAEIVVYDDVLRGLLERAAGAFLTTALEERLESFNEFLRQSAPAVELRVANVVEISVGLGAFRASSMQSGTSSRRLPISSISLSILGARLTVREVAVQYAPLGTREFEERFVQDTAILRALVKEVTLGTHVQG
ncbi:hypothetical protein [Amycolatopsis sp. MEPSY49]|uniref:hypothetical protein n=1 Tax=Amycolatopsis sp. MEPSY49 TaxID=3151600 RepID=UPI003EF0E5D0